MFVSELGSEIKKLNDLPRTVRAKLFWLLGLHTLPERLKLSRLDPQALACFSELSSIQIFYSERSCSKT